jgi:hypothetical protein
MEICITLGRVTVFMVDGKFRWKLLLRVIPRGGVRGRERVPLSGWPNEGGTGLHVN